MLHRKNAYHANLYQSLMALANIEASFARAGHRPSYWAAKARDSFRNARTFRLGRV